MKVKIYDFNERSGSTHKRIGIGEYIDYALSKNADTISVISSGNLFMELKNEIQNRDLSIGLVNLINESYEHKKGSVPMLEGRILKNSSEREEYLSYYGKKFGGDYGKVVDVTDFIPDAYSKEADLILESKPDYVSLPVGSGKNFISIYRGVKKNMLDTKIIGFVPKGSNGVFPENCFEENGSLFFKKFNSKSMADKLITPYINEDHLKEILEAIDGGNIIYEMTPSEERRAIKESKKYDVETEPSSSTAFYALTNSFRKKHSIGEDKSITVINTGKGSKEFDVVSVPISPLKKFQSLVVLGFSILSLIGILQGGSRVNLEQEMEKRFYEKYHPNLLVDGQLPVMGPSLLDRLVDERSAFVNNVTTDRIYLSKKEADRISLEGLKERQRLRN